MLKNREEGAGKLFLSGFGFRMGFYLINGSIMLNGYESFRNMVKEAYEWMLMYLFK